MRAAAASAGKPWNGWKARIRAPMHQRPRPAAADQGSNQASILHCICYSNLPIAIFYSVQFAFDPNPANKTTSVNQHTPRSQVKQHDPLCPIYIQPEIEVPLPVQKSPQNPLPRNDDNIPLPTDPGGGILQEKSTRCKLKHRVPGTGKGVEGSARVTYTRSIDRGRPGPHPAFDLTSYISDSIPVT
jgi:hypothetical protein